MPRIISNIDNRFNAIKGKAAAASAAKKPATDTRAAVLKMLGENFEKVEVKGGMVFKVPAGIEGKNHLASIRGKLISVTREGQPWAGRKYKIALDKEANEVVVGRLEDGVALPQKKGGRPKGSTNANKANGSAIPGLEAAKAHLGGNNGKPEEKVADVTPPANLTGAALASWMKKHGGGNGAVKDLTS